MSIVMCHQIGTIYEIVINEQGAHGGHFSTCVCILTISSLQKIRNPNVSLTSPETYIIWRVLHPSRLLFSPTCHFGIIQTLYLRNPKA